MRLIIFLRSSSESSFPSSSETPTSLATCSAGPSILTIFPVSSNAIRRPPTAKALVAVSFPFSQSASLIVPPPTSILRTVMFSLRDKATAPEPFAAIKDSRWCPADAHTNFPDLSAKRSAIARAFVLLSASPVNITAPVSISSGVSSASL